MRRLNAEWIVSTRRFALAAWLCLGIGIVLGARWTYAELGWGGYWAWDPVENASLLPWLTGTAFLHSIMIQEKRGMLKVWNVSLVLATGTLAILGTFLVRSGILDSIHAFGASTLGVPFVVADRRADRSARSALVVWRRADLRSEHRLDSLLSREAVFLLNNLVFVALAFVIFWGTFFPLISEAFTGDQASVGPPWFDRTRCRSRSSLVALAGIGPLIAWRRVTLANAAAQLRAARSWAALITLVAAARAGVRGRAPRRWPCSARRVRARRRRPGAVARRRARARRYSASRRRARSSALVRRNRRRYGGYIVHVGIAVLFVGVAASSAFQHAHDVRLKPGQTAHGRRLRHPLRQADRPVVTRDGGSSGSRSARELDVTKDGHTSRRCAPTRGYYPSREPFAAGRRRCSSGEATSEVGLSAGLRRDIWTAVAARPRAAALDATVHRRRPRAVRTAATAARPRRRSRYAPALHGWSSAT